MAQDPLVRRERFLLYVTDGRMRVWRHKNTAYTRRNIQPIFHYSGCSVMVWRCISHDCRLDLVTIQGNLTGRSNIASGIAAAITTGHPTSNWSDETQGWGRHPSTWDLHPYRTLNNRCRQVIHKWRFESEMTILSCFLNCEGQYLKWTKGV